MHAKELNTERQEYMAKVIMTCGKICTGKSTYAEKLRRERKGIVLSVDEITLALFGQDVGDKHDEYVEKAENYLLKKSLEIIENDIDVILDWGFWQKSEREYAREFYGRSGVDYEFHYIDISDDEWKKRIEKRNKSIKTNELSAYFVDEGLALKSEGFFEKPTEDEIDIWVRNY